MGVYINMEMPQSCDECRIMVFEDTNCDPELYCGCPIVFKAHPQGIGHRPDYCPLVPVPPHGDLIDRREAIIDANERAYDFWLSDDEVSATIRFLNEQTTIIPAEEGE